jgi:predicted ATPase
VPAQQCGVLYGLRSFHFMRAEYQAAQAAAEQLLDVAQRQPDSAWLPAAHYALGQTLNDVGALALARTHLEQGIALDDPQRHATPHTAPGGMRRYGVLCRARVPTVLWALGYPYQAVQRSQEALTMAHALANPLVLVSTLFMSLLLHRCRREWQTVQARAETMLALATEHGFARYAMLHPLSQGMALVWQGQGEAGIAQMRQGLAAMRATGSAAGMAGYLAQLAEAYGQVGQVGEGLHLLTKALAVVDTTGGRFYEAELHRLHGGLLLRQAIPDAS